MTHSMAAAPGMTEGCSIHTPHPRRRRPECAPISEAHQGALAAQESLSIPKALSLSLHLWGPGTGASLRVPFMPVPPRVQTR